ncbi:MAG TPA: SRPBCC family protein [Terracidiphilus sp.]
MSGIAWAIDHGVETLATPEFAWMYMTDVTNWDDPPARFRLNGPFTTGSIGTTEIPGQALREWRLRDVGPPHSYTIEIALEGAVIVCKWQFAKLPGGRTRLRQTITLEGENTAPYKEDVKGAFAPGLAPGMNRIARAINAAYVQNQASS